jgi:ribose/xylose/arabinose/galactoside ABC-type transport system permease subunit
LIFILAFIFFIVMYFIDDYTPFGRRIRAIGGEEKVARLAGIKISRTYIFIFATAGALVGIAGVLQASRSAAGIPTTGTGFELDVIASVVLGGTTLTGGVGGVLGTIMGALTMTALSSGLNIVGVSPYGQYVVKGLVLMAAVFISIDRSKIGVIK